MKWRRERTRENSAISAQAQTDVGMAQTRANTLSPHSLWPEGTVRHLLLAPCSIAEEVQ